VSTGIQEVGGLLRAQKGCEGLVSLTKFGLKVYDHYRTISIRTDLCPEARNAGI
jgi:hypothetical protein